MSQPFADSLLLYGATIRKTVAFLLFEDGLVLWDVVRYGDAFIKVSSCVETTRDSDQGLFVANEFGCSQVRIC